MDEKYRLIPTVDSRKLGESYYLFDRSASSGTVIFVPTQKVTKAMSQVVQAIKKRWPSGEGATVEEIKSIFDSAADIKRVGILFSSGYIESIPAEMPSPRGDDAKEDEGEPLNPQAIRAEMVGHFQSNVLKHYLTRPAFFNLPADIPDAEVHVGLSGVPVSSISMSSGTIFGPDRMRQNSQAAGFWFDYYKNGVYTEIGCEGTAPRVIGKDIILKDYGNLGEISRTVGDLFTEIREHLQQTIFPNGIRPIFIGGDHSITFPIGDAFVQQYPEMVLIQLDAHNDLFYTQRVEFNHAGPMHGLLVQSGLRQLHSFGLRTNLDERTTGLKQIERLAENGDMFEDRVRLHSISAFQRMLNNPEALEKYLREEVGSDVPCYMTIDLDVLSAGAVGSQLSTPAGAGIEMYQLLEFVKTAGDVLNIVGADIVEYCVNGKMDDDSVKRDTTTLLVHLTDAVYRSGKRHNLERTVATQPAQMPAQKSAVQNPVPLKKLPPVSSAGSARLEVEPVPRKSINDLDYETFLKQHVIPGIPLVLTDIELPSNFKQWSFEYFLQKVNRQQALQVNVFSELFQHATAKLRTVGLWDMLSLMRQRSLANLTEQDERYNIVDWGFRVSNPELVADIPIHPFFSMDISPLFTGDENSFKWIYFGEPGTGSATHIDVMNSSAWLLLATGQKNWRMVHCDYHERCSSRGGMVDLFDVDAEEFPATAGMPVWETEQKPGEIVWTPPRCIHAVRNMEYSIAVTQNYIDLGNLNHVLLGLFERSMGVVGENGKPDIPAKIQAAIASMEDAGLSQHADLLLPQLRAVLESGIAPASMVKDEMESGIELISKADARLVS